MARTVTTFFNMKENYSGGMRRAARATSEFQSKVTAAARVLDRENRKRREIRIQNRQANASIAAVQAQMKKIKDLRINIAARVSNFKRDMRPVTNDIKNLVKKPLLVTLKLKDMAMAGLRKTADILKMLAKGAIIGISAAGAVLGYTLGKGATLQQYQASIEHNVFAADRTQTETQIQAKAKGYADFLTDFAAKTTASVDDVFSGGAHALMGTGGDISAAKGLVKIAQDMSAQKPGSNMWDAVESLLDASRGQFMRINEFGFKMTAEGLKAANGDMFLAKDKMGRTLAEAFEGAETRKAKTGAGTWDSIKGTIEGGVMNAGANILTALQPMLTAMLPYADTIATKMADMGTSIGDWLANTIPKLGELWDSIKTNMEPLITWFNEKWAMLQPFRDFAANAFAGVNVDGEKVLGGITGAIDQLVNTLISWLNGLAANWDKIEPVIAGIIKYLPQIALAFAGLKVVGWGVTTGKAVGNLFGGLGSFIGKLFGGGKTPTVTSTPDTVLNKPDTATPKAGPNTNTFTGPNYNTFQGPNTNSQMPGTGPGTGNGMPLYFPPVGNPFQLGGGNPTLNLPTGQTPLGLPSGDSSGTGAGTGIAGIWKWLQSGLLGAGLIAAIASTETEIKRMNELQKQYPTFTLFDWMSGKPNPADTPKPVTAPVTLSVNADYSGLLPGLKTILEGNTLKGNIQLMTYNGGGSGLPNVMEPQAAGIKRVPWDNYPALLHKGETVLPSGEAGEYRDQGNRRSGGVTISGVTVHINGVNKNGEQMAAEFVRGLEHAAFNMA